MTISVLSSFSLRIHRAIHICNSLKQAISLRMASSQATGTDGSYSINICVSSAYFWYFEQLLCFFTNCRIGVVYRMDSIGPITEPCGTPLSKGVWSDVAWPSFTRCVCCLSYVLTHVRALPAIQNSPAAALIVGWLCQGQQKSPAWQRRLPDSCPWHLPNHCALLSKAASVLWDTLYADRYSSST